MEIEHIKILKDEILYYGGNQSWFNNRIRKTACGMIASCDVALGLIHKNCQPVFFEEYRRFIEDNAKKFFYKNRLNLFGISINRVLKYLNSLSFPLTFRFIGRRKLNEHILRSQIEKSLNAGLPIIVRIGENFNRLPCKIYFHDIKKEPVYSTMRWHYITAVGIENDMLIFYSWGRKGEVKLSDLCKYLGFTGGIIVAE